MRQRGARRGAMGARRAARHVARREAAFPQRPPRSSWPPPFRVPVAQSSISMRNVSRAVAAAHAEIRSVAISVEPLPISIYEVLRRRRAALAPIPAHAISGPVVAFVGVRVAAWQLHSGRPSSWGAAASSGRVWERGAGRGFGAVRSVRARHGSAVYRTSGRSFICRKDFLLICL